MHRRRAPGQGQSVDCPPPSFRHFARFHFRANPNVIYQFLYSTFKYAVAVTTPRPFRHLMPLAFGRQEKAQISGCMGNDGMFH